MLDFNSFTEDGEPEDDDKPENECPCCGEQRRWDSMTGRWICACSGCE